MPPPNHHKESLMEYPLLLSLGLFAGVLAGFFGIGGGTFIVPAMILLGHDIKTAVGISIMQMTFSSLFGSYVNFKKRNLDFNDGLYVGIGGFIGAAWSGLVVATIPSKILEITFLCLIIYSIYRFSRNKNDETPSSLPHAPSRYLLIAIGAFVGVFAISLGIGGGLLLAPLLGYYLGYNSKKSIPIALFFVIFSSVSGFLSLAYHGYVDYKHGIIVGLSSLLGVRLGIALLQRIDAKRHKRALLVMYVVVLVVMAKKILGL